MVKKRKRPSDTTPKVNHVVVGEHELHTYYNTILSKVAPSINIILAILGLYVVFYSLVIGFCKFIVWLSAL